MACSLVELSEAVDENATGDASAKQRPASTLRFANIYRVHLVKADSILLSDALFHGPSGLTKLCTGSGERHCTILGILRN